MKTRNTGAWAIGRAATFAVALLGLATCGGEEPDSGDLGVTTSAVTAYSIAVTPLGSIFKTGGGYDSLTMNDIETASTLSTGYFGANRARLAAVLWAANENRRGLCDDAGAEAYGAYYCFLFFCRHDEWCSEFALWILHHAGIDPGDYLTGKDTLGYVTTEDTAVLFGEEGRLWNRGDLTSVHQGDAYHYPQPGDYLFMRSGSDNSHWGHSGVVVGLSDDSRFVYTVEGNSSGHCVTFHVRDYLVDGVLSDKIDAVGTVQTWADATPRYPFHVPGSPTVKGAPDPVCAKGILNSASGACCPASCGTCGGNGCGSRPGGASACCSGSIVAASVSCATAGPPCMVTDPDCTYGLLSPSYGVCCASSCGTCGGNGCSGRPGGAGACCISHVVNANMSCADQGAPCMVQ